MPQFVWHIDPFARLRQSPGASQGSLGPPQVRRGACVDYSSGAAQHIPGTPALPDSLEMTVLDESDQEASHTLAAVN